MVREGGAGILAGMLCVLNVKYENVSMLEQKFHLCYGISNC